MIIDGDHGGRASHHKILVVLKLVLQACHVTCQIVQGHGIPILITGLIEYVQQDFPRQSGTGTGVKISDERGWKSKILRAEIPVFGVIKPDGVILIRVGFVRHYRPAPPGH